MPKLKTLRVLTITVLFNLTGLMAGHAYLQRFQTSSHLGWADSVRMVALSLGASRQVLKPYEAYAWLSYSHYLILRFTFKLPDMVRNAAAKLSLEMGPSAKMLPMGRHVLSSHKNFELWLKDPATAANEEAWKSLRKEIQEMPDLLIPLPVISFTQKLEEQIRQMQEQNAAEGLDKILPKMPANPPAEKSAPKIKSLPGEKQTA